MHFIGQKSNWVLSYAVINSNEGKSNVLVTLIDKWKIPVFIVIFSSQNLSNPAHSFLSLLCFHLHFSLICWLSFHGWLTIPLFFSALFISLMILNLFVQPINQRVSSIWWDLLAVGSLQQLYRSLFVPQLARTKALPFECFLINRKEGTH
jgi:hypothetical protein